MTDEGRAAADRALALLEALRPGAVDPSIALGPYSEYWLRLAAGRVSASSLRVYSTVRLHIPNALWRTKVTDVTRPIVKAWVMGLAKEHAPATTNKFLAVMRLILNEAVDDGLLRANPAIGLGRLFRLEKKTEVKAMTYDQLQTFLVVAQATEAELWAQFAVLADAGLRRGEARGLKFEDVDFEHKVIRVERQVYEFGGVGPPKRGKTRRVELSDRLAEVLRQHIAMRREYDMRTGRRSSWLLFPFMSPIPTQEEARLAADRVTRAMRRILDEAGLPDRFTPHSLRHTYATLLLSRGERIEYVARQLGDTLAIAAEIYGRWAVIPSTAGGPNLLSDGAPPKKTMGSERWE